MPRLKTPNVRYTIIIIHGVPTSFQVTSAGHGYWRLCRRSISDFGWELNFVRFHLYIAEDSKVVSLNHIQLGPNVVGNRGLAPSEQKTCQHCCYMYLAFPRSYMCCNSRIGQSCERVSKEKVSFVETVRVINFAANFFLDLVRYSGV